MPDANNLFESGKAAFSEAAYSKAYNTFQQSAAFGNGEAAFALAMMASTKGLVDGKYNKAQAYAWFIVAEANGVDNAKPIVKMLDFEADNDMFDDAHKEADRLLKLIASNKAAFAVKK